MDDLFTYSKKASWLEIDTDALKKNIGSFRHVLRAPAKLGVVLKGNAYGHGLEQVFPVVHPLVDCIYVITPQDAFKMRQMEAAYALPKKQILVMGAVSLEEVIECAGQDIDVTVAESGWDEIRDALRKLAVRVNVHIHLDTGLNREGFLYNALDRAVDFFNDAKDVIRVIGAMSHFADTEDVTVQHYALSQIEAFNEGTKFLEDKLSLDEPLQKHMAATTATLVLPNAHYGIVRVGIGLYGLWASREAKLSTQYVLKERFRLVPALSWKCKSQSIKAVKKGSYVGYGCTYRTAKDSRIAVLPVGYYDGYSRLITQRGYVLVNQQRCPTIGRVMMNHMIVDVTLATTDQDREIEAILIGSDGDEGISTETMAGWAETISYEITTRLGTHLKRITLPYA